ncbi:MAG: class I SAM-dependent methyltransferase [Verrucomicrobiota bacterium]|nr:class I SAM-dependent methyltransferase [Verrucomicrobiota bacterium]
MTDSENGWKNSADAWIKRIDEGDPNREYLLDPVMLGLCGDVAGKRVLDAGCGEGRFCRMLSAKGAITTGVDPTAKLIAAARQRHPKGEYIMGLAERMPFKPGTFDLVVSYVALVDIAGYKEAIREMADMLKPGGKLVVANLTSFATATTTGWARGADREKLHWTMDHYMMERGVWADWCGIRIINHHRPLSAYMKAFLGCGLVLEFFDEPVPTAEQLSFAPSLDDSSKKPDFVVMRWRKG